MLNGLGNIYPNVNMLSNPTSDDWWFPFLYSNKASIPIRIIITMKVNSKIIVFMGKVRLIKQHEKDKHLLIQNTNIYLINKIQARVYSIMRTSMKENSEMIFLMVKIKYDSFNILFCLN